MPRLSLGCGSGSVAGRGTRRVLNVRFMAGIAPTQRVLPHAPAPYSCFIILLHASAALLLHALCILMRKAGNYDKKPKAMTGAKRTTGDHDPEISKLSVRTHLSQSLLSLLVSQPRSARVHPPPSGIKWNQIPRGTRRVRHPKRAAEPPLLTIPLLIPSDGSRLLLSRLSWPPVVQDSDNGSPQSCD